MSVSPTHVAVAVIYDPTGRVLIALRPAHVHQGNLWEFPGGKIEPNETVLDALKREIREELDLTVEAARPLLRVSHHYPDKQVLLDVWEITQYRGEATGKEGQTLRWIEVGALSELKFPAANLAIIRAVSLPDRYMITPEPDKPERFLANLEQALRAGVRLVQVRIKHRSNAQRELIERAIGLCEQYQARVLVNSALIDMVGFDAVGMHLTACDLHKQTQRPVSDRQWLAASCHNLADLQKANDLGVDFVVLGPVRHTRSHPDADPLGWTEFAACCEQARMPVYALGGMRIDDIDTARRHGGQGIAAIRALWPRQGARE